MDVIWSELRLRKAKPNEPVPPEVHERVRNALARGTEHVRLPGWEMRFPRHGIVGKGRKGEISGVWCPPELVLVDEEQAGAIFDERALESFLLTPDAEFDPDSVELRNPVWQMREVGLGDFVCTTTEELTGKKSNITAPWQAGTGTDAWAIVWLPAPSSRYVGGRSARMMSGAFQFRPVLPLEEMERARDIACVRTFGRSVTRMVAERTLPLIDRGRADAIASCREFFVGLRGINIEDLPGGSTYAYEKLKNIELPLGRTWNFINRIARLTGTNVTRSSFRFDDITKKAWLPNNVYWFVDRSYASASVRCSKEIEERVVLAFENIIDRMRRRAVRSLG